MKKPLVLAGLVSLLLIGELRADTSLAFSTGTANVDAHAYGRYEPGAGITLHPTRLTALGVGLELSQTSMSQAGITSTLLRFSCGF